MANGPVVDVHVHLQLDDDSQMAGRSHRLADYEGTLGDLRLIAAGVLVMAPRNDLPRTRELNNLALAAAEEDTRLYAMCSVHPADDAKALAEVDRVAAAGARGLKLHPNTQEFDVADDGVAKIVRRAGERGLPVLFDSWSVTDPAQPGKFVNLITGCPETQVILAHMLGPSFLELLVYRVLAEYPSYARNAWFELSGIAPLYADSPLAAQLTWLCRELGVDRVLFGSDYPFFGVGSALRAVDRLGFSPVEVRQITHDNAASLFRLDDGANG